ncbi:MAG: HAMP domain-containing histidine kinase [Solirubrobacterales bacterium]|nr:HAMP domain-containing histidine kinase [Solirubrobacterales bacterium]
MRSLRAHLTAGLTVVLAVVLLGVGAFASRTADRSDRAALDDRLLRTAQLSRATALAAVQEEVPPGDDRLDAVLDATRSSLKLVVADQVVLETGDQLRPAPRLRGGFSTVTADGIRYRALVTSLRDQSLGGLARLELTTSLGPLEARQRDVRRDLALLCAGGLLLGAAGVYLAGAVVLRPLRRLKAATSGIVGDEDLDRRAPENDGPAELRELATSFNAMLARLKRTAVERECALAATRRFTADAGHELRTPLTGVQTTLSSLARHPDAPAEQRARMAADALEQQKRLVALLDGLQALARGDAPPGRAPVDLAEVADSAVAAARERYPGVRWSADLPDEPVIVNGWEPGLRAVVDNLLNNAAIHGRTDGTVWLSVSSGPPVAIRVEDDGPGIPTPDRGRILEPFSRLGIQEAPGSGLGLAIVAQQAAQHGATIEVVDSERLGGARFTVSWRAST